MSQDAQSPSPTEQLNTLLAGVANRVDNVGLVAVKRRLFRRQSRKHADHLV